MKLIVGLGNPGVSYETTRHNAGFLILDILSDECDIKLAQWKAQGELGKGPVLGETAFLFKPHSYMNLSGRPVSNILRFFKIEENDLIVIHDDIDIPFGRVRARIGGSPGGHKGIASIINETGLKDFHRIKIGVGRPEDNEDQRDVKDWVLGPMSDKELELFDKEIYDEVILRLENIFKQRQKQDI